MLACNMNIALSLILSFAATTTLLAFNTNHKSHTIPRPQLQSSSLSERTIPHSLTSFYGHIIRAHFAEKLDSEVQENSHETTDNGKNLTEEAVDATESVTENDMKQEKVKRKQERREYQQTQNSFSSLFSTTSASQQFVTLPTFFASLDASSQLSSIYNDLPSPQISSKSSSRKLKPTYALLISYDGRYFPGGFEYNSQNLKNEEEEEERKTVRGTLTKRIRSTLFSYIQQATVVQNTTDTASDDQLTITDSTRRKKKKSRKDNVKTNTNIRIASAGRTDANVSAKANLVSFNTYTDMDLNDLISNVNQLASSSCNAGQDADVYIHRGKKVHSSFHATFGTVAREYIYVLPLLYRNCDETSREEEKEIYKRIATVADKMLEQVVNTPMDYIGMSSGKLSSKNTICTILDAGCWCYDSNGQAVAGGGCVGDSLEEVAPGFGNKWKKYVDAELLSFDRYQLSTDSLPNIDNNNEEFTGQCLVFKLKGNRFLRRMVRKIVNSVLQEAEDIVSLCSDVSTINEKYDTENHWIHQWEERIQEKQRSGNGPAPPGGLCFWGLEVDPTFMKGKK